MLNCKQFVKSVSSNNLSGNQSEIKLFFHRLICVHCRKYYNQIKIIKNEFVKLNFKISNDLVIDKDKLAKLEKKVIHDQLNSKRGD
jgi:hypothetical protein